MFTPPAGIPDPGARRLAQYLCRQTQEGNKPPTSIVTRLFRGADTAPPTAYWMLLAIAHATSQILFPGRYGDPYLVPVLEPSPEAEMFAGPAELELAWDLWACQCTARRLIAAEGRGDGDTATALAASSIREVGDQTMAVMVIGYVLAELES